MTKIAPLFDGNTTLDVEPEEPRSGARRRMLKTGQICYNERHTTLECAVHDLSEHGARLRVSGSIDAPDAFELFVELDGIWVDCEVVWRSNSEIGVVFTSEKIQEVPKRKQVIQQRRVTIVKPTLRRRPIQR